MTNPKPIDEFGTSVSVSGDALLVGVPFDDNSNGSNAGSVIVFGRDVGGNNAWGKVKKVLSSNGGHAWLFGASVAVSAHTAVVGSPYNFGPGQLPGTAYVIKRDWGGANNWGEVARLVASGTSAGDNFGFSVSIAGNTIAVGAPFDDTLGMTAGAAYVFERNLGGPDSWGQAALLLASTGGASDKFGAYVSISGDTIVVGAPRHSQVRGSAFVYERDMGGAGAWGEVTELEPSDGTAGDSFGPVSISSDTIMVGAPLHNTQQGAAYVFARHQGGLNTWGELRKLLPSSPGGSWFGLSVSIMGETAAVGTRPGAVCVFARNAGGPSAWSEVVQLTPWDGGGAGFGTSVSAADSTIAVGAPYDNDHGLRSGAAYVFEDTSVAVSYCTAGVSQSGCRAIVTACGSPSAIAPFGFFLTASGVEGQRKGMFFYGANGRQAAPWGGSTSFQCVAPPVRRGSLLSERGTTAKCDGVFIQDLNARWCPTCPKWKHNPGAGAVVQSQFWYRDPFSTSNQTTAISDALEFTVGL